MMNKILAILFLTISLASTAQTSKDEIYLPETIDLHLDKDFYFTGDRIWYSLYLSNSPRAVNSLSMVAYVELRDSRDSIVFRQKLKCKDGLAHGDWLISRKLTTGKYKLSAFTSWMRNTPGDICQRMLLIVNPDVVLPSIADPKPEIVSSTQANPFNPLQVSTGKSTVRTGERVVVAIELTDSTGNPLSGNVSASVRLKNSFTSTFPSPFTYNDVIASSEEKYSKEKFISPPSASTLPPITKLENIKPYPANISDSQMKDVMSMGIMRKIVRSYALEPLYNRDNYYNIPANLSYEPSNYSSLSSLQEFIKEIVPQIKIRRSQSQRKFYVRSQGSSAGVFFFKEPALVLVDGRVVDNIDAVLEMELREIEKIDITWSTYDINRLGMFALADNGIVSFTTNSRTRFREGYKEIFKDFYTPLVFSEQPQSSIKEDRLPRVIDPTYWNPAIPVDGKTRIEVGLGDNAGEYIVDVRGITNDGRYVQASTTISVAAAND
jgi:hypothetical protein